MIYVVTHNNIEIPFNKDNYQLPQVGFCEDITIIILGDNISEKNARYCEFTGLFW